METIEIWLCDFHDLLLAYYRTECKANYYNTAFTVEPSLLATPSQRPLYFVPGGQFIHWLLLNLSITATSLQWQQPQQHVLNCQNNLNNSQFFSATDEKVKNGREIWSLCNLRSGVIFIIIIIIIFLLFWRDSRERAWSQANPYGVLMINRGNRISILFHLFCCSKHKLSLNTLSECYEPCSFFHVSNLIQKIFKFFFLYFVSLSFTIGLPL